MEPIKQEKPSPQLFLLMTLVYFASYFGLKYGVFGGMMPWYYNLILILACLGLALWLRGRGKSK